MAPHGKTVRMSVHLSLFDGHIPKSFANLHEFGQAGMVKFQGKNTCKTDNRGAKMMYVGVPVDHPVDCFLMYNHATGKLVTTRDVTWLDEMFFSPGTVPIADAVAVPTVPPSSTTRRVVTFADEHSTAASSDDDTVADSTGDDADTGDDAEDDAPSDASDDGSDVGSSDDDDPVPFLGDVDAVARNEGGLREDRTPVTTASGRVSRQPDRLIASMMAIERTDAEAAQTPMEHAFVGAGIGGGFDHTSELKPMKYNEAINATTSAEEMSKWREAIDLEFKKMEDNGVMEPIRAEDVPKGTNIIDSRWVFKRKANGTYRARLVARGYSQIPGQDYDVDDIYGPVANETTIMVVLTIIVMCGYYVDLVDVTGAFLIPVLDKPLYMKPPRENAGPYHGRLCKIKKTLYGLTQSSNEFWKVTNENLLDMEFECSQVDPCL